jgi:glycosyltransferase involved in cell wall biosynthesis
LNTRFSIIVCFRDEEKFLADCLFSILSQDFSEFEAILIDDGSSDNSASIARLFCANDSRLRYKRLPGHSLGRARNYGIEQARGSHIIFLDADDMLEPGTLAALSRENQRVKHEIISFNSRPLFELATSAEVKKRQEHRLGRFKLRPFRLPGPVSVILLAIQSSYIHSACLICVDRNLINREKIRFPEGILHEDIEFTLRVFLAAREVRHIDKIFHVRRFRECSITSRPSANNIRDLKEIHQRLEQFESSPALSIISRLAVRFVIPLVGKYRADLERKVIQQSTR